jgi:hypothetical protein
MVRSEGEPEEEKVEIEIPSDVEEVYEEEPTTMHEYLSAAYYALQALSEVDTAIITKNEAQRLNRAKRKSRKIIYYVIEQYAEELGL